MLLLTQKADPDGQLQIPCEYRNLIYVQCFVKTFLHVYKNRHRQYTEGSRYGLSDSSLSTRSVVYSSDGDYLIHITDFAHGNASTLLPPVKEEDLIATLDRVINGFPMYVPQNKFNS